MGTYGEGPHYAPVGHVWAYTGRANSRRHIAPTGENQAVCGVNVPVEYVEATYGETSLDSTEMCPRCEKWMVDGATLLGCGCPLLFVRDRGHQEGCDG
jgi:hypothetical protein